MLKGYNFLGQSINTGICLSIAVLDFPKRQPVQRVPVVINNRCIVSFNVVSPTYKYSVTLNPFLLMVSYQITTSILKQIQILNTKKEFPRKGLLGMRVSLQEFSFNLAETRGVKKKIQFCTIIFFIRNFINSYKN